MTVPTGLIEGLDELIPCTKRILRSLNFLIKAQDRAKTVYMQTIIAQVLFCVEPLLFCPHCLFTVPETVVARTAITYSADRLSVSMQCS